MGDANELQLMWLKDEADFFSNFAYGLLDDGFAGVEHVAAGLALVGVVLAGVAWRRRPSA
jgi:hypothetical protein